MKVEANRNASLREVGDGPLIVAVDTEREHFADRTGDARTGRGQVERDGIGIGGKLGQAQAGGARKKQIGKGHEKATI